VVRESEPRGFVAFVAGLTWASAVGKIVAQEEPQPRRKTYLSQAFDVM
jgi:hypothetical protein